MPFTASIEDAEETPPIHEPTPAVTETPPLLPIIATAPLIVIMDKPFEDQKHPFQNAKDATYALPTTQNVGALAKVPLIKANTPAYRTLLHVHNASIAIEVFK